MTNLYTVGEHVLGLIDEPVEVDAVFGAIRLHSASPSRELESTDLSETIGTGVSASDCRKLLYALEGAGVVEDGEIVDRSRFEAAAGCAKALVEEGPPPENDVVVNVPEEDADTVGRSLGSLVVRLMELIGNAEEELIILNPFFTEEAFKNVVGPVVGAVNRGVSVTLITRYLTYGSDEDSRGFVNEILNEGTDADDLQLYEYVDLEGDRLASIHAKLTIVDGEAAYLGTANMTHRGLRDNLEVGVIFRDDTVVQLSKFVDELTTSQHLHEVVVVDGSFERV